VQERRLRRGEFLMKIVRGKFSLAAAAVLIATPLLVAATSSKSKAARVTVVHCGDTITTSIVLANDLDCSSSATMGLIVGANGITINLNGHTISGPANGFYYGIADSGHSGATLENGTIVGFSAGAVLDHANGSRVQSLRLMHNGSGVFASNSDSVVITGNYALSNTAYGVFVQGGSGDLLSGNWAENNTLDGIVVDPQSTAAVLSQNRALDNGQIGISVGHGSTGQVSGNVANGNGNDGITTVGAGSSLTLTGNRAAFNGALGISAWPGQRDGGGNVVQDNATALQCKNIVCAEVSS
jgi:parallel beta-helix repeat protein